MKYWEFLIQKEGDRDWLPLETQQVEILEGRYRVVAHTDRANTPVDVRVSQLITEEMPPRQRVRKRRSSTNESGLVVVMPFVHLQPGQWTLKCSSVGDAAGDLLDDGWQYGVQLQVFAQTEEDWSSEWPVPEDAPLDSERSDLEADLVNADLPLLQAQAELKQVSQQAEEPTDTPEESSAEQPDASAAYRVSLKQQAYLSQHGVPMTIVGRVSALTEAVGESASQLWIRLQNPQTAGVIMEAHRPLSLARLPADFKVQIQLPSEVKTRVVLGEVSLRTAAIDRERPAQVLASTAFTITAGIDQILDAIASQDPGTFEEEISVLSADSKSSEEPTVPTFDTDSLERSAVVPSGQAVLPPKLTTKLDGEQLAESLDELPARIGSSLIDLPTFDQTVFKPGSDGAQIPEEERAIAEDEATRSERQSLEQPTEPSNEPSNEPSDDSSQVEVATPIPPASSAMFDRPAVEPVSRPPMVSAPAQFVGTSIEDSDLEADEITAALDDIDSDLLDESSELDALEAPGIEGVVESMSRPSRQAEVARSPNPVPEVAPSSPSPQKKPVARKSGREVEAHLAFQSLKLKDHFWERLSTLTKQSHEEATKLAAEMEAAGVSRSGGFSSLAPVSSTLDGYASDEVVIYDDPPSEGTSEEISAQESRTAQMPSGSPAQSVSRYGDPLKRLDALRGGAAPSFEQTAAQRTSPAISDRETVGNLNGTVSSQRNFSSPIANSPTQPMGTAEVELPEMALPVISLPTGDLVAGQTVTVTVRSRPSTYKPFIKLWMVDRQSRSLVIEPKILTNLMPDALGDLQGTTDLQVPLDCLDVQIAAIAIDMATQQESGKAVVNRRVVPANQTSPRGGFSL